MNRFRKQTHHDFRRRIKRVDPAFFRFGDRGATADATPHRPFGSLVLGFAGAYLVVSVASNRSHLETSLAQGSLSQEVQSGVMMGLAALLAMSLVMLAIHVVRFVGARRGGKKKNSGAVLTGILGALMLIYTPASVWEAGFGMVDSNSRSLILAASSTVDEVLPGVDLGSAVFVSSFNE